MIIEKFKNQVVEFPEKIAVKAGNREITYSQLDNFATLVAHAIITGHRDRPPTGGTNQRVSLLFEHGADMIIAVIGALKAGRTYVPLDVTYPLKRLSYMLEDSESYLILTNRDNRDTAEQLAGRARHKIDIITIDSIVAEAEENPASPKG